MDGGSGHQRSSATLQPADELTWPSPLPERPLAVWCLVALVGEERRRAAAREAGNKVEGEPVGGWRLSEAEACGEVELAPVGLHR